MVAPLGSSAANAGVRHLEAAKTSATEVVNKPTPSTARTEVPAKVKADAETVSASRTRALAEDHRLASLPRMCPAKPTAPQQATFDKTPTVRNTVGLTTHANPRTGGGYPNTYDGGFAYSRDHGPHAPTPPHASQAFANGKGSAILMQVGADLWGGAVPAKAGPDGRGYTGGGSVVPRATRTHNSGR